METRSRTRSMLRGAAVLAALGALAAPATAGAAVKAPVIKSITPKHLNVGDKLIIRGKYFRVGKGKNRVLFQRVGGKSLFVRADVSTKVRMTVVVPKALELYMPSSAGSLVPARFRVRVLTSKLSKRFTSLKSSPVIGPKPVKPTGTGTGTGPSTPVSPDGDCDGDGVKNSVDVDDDNDLLPDQLELAIGTQPCNSDSDGDGVEDGYEYQSALDLNNDNYQNVNQVVPYPGKRPYPNPLFKDQDVDYDGDGLTLGTEYGLWKYSYTTSHTATRTLTPLSYSDGTKYSLTVLNGGPVTAANYPEPQQFAAWAALAGYGSPVLHVLGTASTTAAYNLYDFNRDGSVTNAERYYWAEGNPNTVVSDDMRDEDADGLSNFEETDGPMMGPGWWSACYSDEGSFPVAYAGTSPTDADSDGDGVLDGADDQDHDNVPNIMELSRFAATTTRSWQGGSQICTAADLEVKDNADPQAFVNPFNPCLPDPDPHYTTCPSHPIIGNSDYAPFTSDGDKYFVLN